MSSIKIDVAHLAKAWVHSHEEDTATTSVYRPANYPFPPARGREEFYLQPDGTLAAGRPGPTDQTLTAAGTWRLAGNELELAPQGESAQNLCIESIEPDRLVVKKRPTCRNN
jgi:hypothetical protein